jgi:hypothetical protein
MKSFSSVDEKPMKTKSDTSPARWTREGKAMKQLVLSAMLALAIGAVVASSIAFQPAYAGCGCQP